MMSCTALRTGLFILLAGQLALAEASWFRNAEQDAAQQYQTGEYMKISYKRKPRKNESDIQKFLKSTQQLTNI